MGVRHGVIFAVLGLIPASVITILCVRGNWVEEVLTRVVSITATATGFLSGWASYHLRVAMVGI